MVKDGWELTLIPSMTVNFKTTFPSWPRRNLFGLMETLTFKRSSTPDDKNPNSKKGTMSKRMNLFMLNLSMVPNNLISIYPGLFIKNVDDYFTSTMSITYPDIVEKTFQEESFYIHRRFLPFGRADLTTSASL
jgi:hypothetical protein